MGRRSRWTESGSGVAGRGWVVVLALPIWALACGGGSGQSKTDANPQDGSVPVTPVDGGWVPEGGSTDALPPGDPTLPPIPGAAGDLATRLTAAADDDAAVAVVQEIPDHLSGTAGPVKSIANPLPTTVMQSATWEWDLRRYK